MKKLYFILFLLFIFIFPSIEVDGIVNPTSDFYVNDYANILSEETENYILNKSLVLNDIDGSQIVVVTINNLEGLSIEDYSLKLFNRFGIGDKYKNNGLLILISLEDREFRIIVGSGMEWLFTDSKIGEIQDEYMVSYFRNSQWDIGIKKGYDIFYDEIYNNINISFIEKNRNVIEIILIFINLLFGLIFPFIFKFIKNNNLHETDRKINIKCFLIYLFILIFIILIEMIININLIVSTILNLMIYGIVYYKINYKSSDNYYKDTDRYGRYGRTSSSGSSGSGGGSSGYRGGGGSSRGSGSSRKF